MRFEGKCQGIGGLDSSSGKDPEFTSAKFISHLRNANRSSGQMPNLRNDTPTPAQTIDHKTKNRSPNLPGLATG